MSKFKLDFNIYYSKDRLEAIKKIPLETLTKSELETVTNYVLYGKDEDDTSSVDRKEIQIKTKFNSYNKDKTVSLDALMESPTFDENQIKTSKTIYKKVKPTINKEKVKNIPGMIELWKEIDRLQNIYDQNSGKIEKQNDTPTLSQSQLYYMKHQLIELKTQQYYLLDSEFQTIKSHKNKGEFHDSVVNSHLTYPILPRGLETRQGDVLFENPHLDSGAAASAVLNEEEILNGDKPYLDFRNEEHLYQIIQHYGELESQIENFPDSLINNLLWTIDFYISKAALSDQQRLIVELKKYRVSNKGIREALIKELGIEHRENYISTIWNKSLGLIKEAVELNYDEFLCKDYKKAWKQCSRCGRTLLRDPRNFVRKAKALDGLTGRCKKCDKEIRKSLK